MTEKQSRTLPTDDEGDYTLTPPSGECISPLGHLQNDAIFTIGSQIPQYLFCYHCHRPWTITPERIGVGPTGVRREA